MILFERLIAAYPYKMDWLLEECRMDIPPLYRGFAWAAIMNVRGDVALVYDQIDTETFTATDRQVCTFFLSYYTAWRNENFLICLDRCRSNNFYPIKLTF
jgi:hypothetical protein